MAALSESRVNEGELPEVIEFEAVEIEASVIDLGVFLHCHAAAVVAPVADRNLKSVNLMDLAARPDLG